MNNNDKNNITNLINIAKSISKNNILNFIKGLYDIDEYSMEHLWNIPIISLSEISSIINTSLSQKNKSEILEILNEEIFERIGDSEATFISFDDFVLNFTDKDIHEYKELLESGQIKEDYNAIIVYDESKFENIYLRLKETNKSQEDIDSDFLREASLIFTHERCHLNANILNCNTKEYKNDNKNIQVIDETELINGANLSLDEIDSLLDNGQPNIDISENDNEILIEILSEFITNYKDGDTPKDMIYRLVKLRGGKSMFETMDDTEVLAIYTLFPDKITKWLILGAYSDQRENLYNSLKRSIIGENLYDLTSEERLNNIARYCKNNKNVDTKQAETLKMLGVFNLEKSVNKSNIKNISNSQDVLINLSRLNETYIKKFLMQSINNIEFNDIRGDTYYD